MSLTDPYHGDPYLKRGRESASDGPERKAQYKAAFRATRKRARQEGKREVELQVAEMIDGIIDDMLWLDFVLGLDCGYGDDFY